MTTMNDDIRKEITKTMDQLRQLRDEAKVKIHLASMDAKQAWDQLEPKIDEAEHAAGQATAKALEAVQHTTKKLRELVASL